MNKEIAERWVKALRNPELKQVQGVLSDGEGFCCLGVLSELALVDGICSKFSQNGHIIYLTKDDFDEALEDNSEDRCGDPECETCGDPAGEIEEGRSSLSAIVALWAGLDHVVGVPRDKSQINIPGIMETFHDLARANDNWVTFYQIADYIEANWEIL